ncbi:hypothetical protein E2C01_057306 [Portunus trituberculatus]|uniref:Uncharacterized protein n=1 Tax=Portunus trituberculatus TaxID=210409 RepID=A0A5B7GWF7_PORTR|nr:hypothetical protein [Portunus trituberculatus]
MEACDKKDRTLKVKGHHNEKSQTANSYIIPSFTLRNNNTATERNKVTIPFSSSASLVPNGVLSAASLAQRQQHAVCRFQVSSSYLSPTIYMLIGSVVLISPAESFHYSMFLFPRGPGRLWLWEMVWGLREEKSIGRLG